MSSGNHVVKKILNTLKEFDGQVQEFIDKADRIKGDTKSRAKAVEDITSTVTWMWTDINLARRDNIISDNKDKLTERTRELLRSQKLHGPQLFNGRVDEILKEEVERTSTSVVVSAVSNIGKTLGQLRYDSLKRQQGREKPKWITQNKELQNKSILDKNQEGTFGNFRDNRRQNFFNKKFSKRGGFKGCYKNPKGYNRKQRLQV